MQLHQIGGHKFSWQSFFDLLKSPPPGEEKMLYQYYHLAGASNNMILCNNQLSYLMKDREPDLIHSEDASAESVFNSSLLY